MCAKLSNIDRVILDENTITKHKDLTSMKR